MTILKTNCTSITGDFLYSDAYVQAPPTVSIKSDDTGEISEITQTTSLNTLAKIPIIGCAAGVIRISLAIIHIIGHTFAAVIFRNSGHLYHVVKGAAELLRGVIELIPIVGNIFAWKHDARKPIVHSSSAHSFYDYSFFLVKISNPEQPDHIDNYLIKLGTRP